MKRWKGNYKSFKCHYTDEYFKKISKNDLIVDM